MSKQLSESRKKLLLVGPTNGSVHVRNYYNLVKNYFDDILVLTMNPVDFCNYELADFSIRNPFSIKKKVKRIRQVIESYAPDVIHIHQANSFAFLTGKANRKKIPSVLTCWGSDVLVLPRKGLFYRLLVKSALKNADYLTADAEYMADAIKELGEKKKVEIVNFGIDFDLTTTIPAKENLIYSNRLHKGLYKVDKIIQSFSDFVKLHPDWKLIVGATGEQTEELKKLAKEILPASSFEFIGFVDAEENRRQYLRSKIWVSIPSTDGTSISLLEAMGYGCIPVISNLPANKEWVDHAENGIIVAENLASSFEQALQLDLKMVQKINLEIIQKRGTKEVNQRMFFRIYDSIFNG